MVETITPVVHGGRGRWLGALALHAAGATSTAAAFGAAVAAVGAALGAPFGRAGPVALASAAALYAAAELPGVRVPVPQLARQVPDWWRTFFGRPVAAILYGAGLGIGFLTYLAHGTLVVVAVAAFASGRPGLGALVLAPFGLARGLSAASAWDATTPDRGRALVDRLASIPDGRRRSANAAALTAVATVAVLAAAEGRSGGWWEPSAAALAAAFAWAAAAKVVAPARWRRALAAHDLPAAVRGGAAWAVPMAEALVPVLVAMGRPRAAAACALALVASFTVELLRIRRRSAGRVPCGCFGGRASVRTSTALIRNGVLAALAALVVMRGTDAAPLASPGIPAPGDVVPFALTVGSIAVAMVLAWRTATWLAPPPTPIPTTEPAVPAP